MNLEVVELRIEKKQSAHSQIATQLRQQIARGDYSTGSRLPSIEEMAKMWDVSAFTVHTALTPLVKSGILVRKRRLGTFIADRPKNITCAAIYYSGEIWGVTGMEFFRALHQQLCLELGTQKIANRVWIDSRPTAEQRSVFPPLQEAIATGEVQCLIAPRTSLVELPHLNKLPIATVCLTTGNSPNRVDYDAGNFLQLSFESLKRRGCRSVGMISAAPVHEKKRMQPEGLYGDIAKLAHEIGLEFREDWLFAPNETAEADTYEQYGYDCFKALWAGKSRPDGLVVYPDTCVRGVVLALSECRVRVPEEIQLVFHRNEGIHILCPFQTAWCVSSVTAIARAMIRQVKDQFAGRSPESIRVPLEILDPV